MSRFVEYAMRMKDMMSGPLGQIAKAFDNVDDHAKKAGKSASLFSKMGNGAFALNNIIGVASTALSMASKVGSAIGETMQASLDRQQLQVSFDVLTGSKEAGSKLTQELVNLQKDTILGKEVFKNAQTMLGFGFANDEVIDNLRMLGDVSMGDAEKLNSLTLAYSQVRSAGKLQGQDLLQLINAGFNPLEAISKRTGKSIGQLKDEMSKGNITFDMVQQAFRDATSEGGKYNHMLETIAKTDAGMKAQLSGAFDELKIKVGNAFAPLTRLGLELGTKLLPVLERLTEPLADGVQKAVDGIDTLMSHAQAVKGFLLDAVQPFVTIWETLRDNMGGLADYLEPVRSMLMDHLWPAVQNMVDAISGMVSDVVEFVAQSEYLKDTFLAVQQVCGFIWDLVNHLVEHMKWMWENVTKPLLEGFEKVYRLYKRNVFGAGNYTNQAVQAATAAQTRKSQASVTNRKLEEIARNTKVNKTAAIEGSKAVAGSGPKVVNINVAKFFDNINFNTTSLHESAAKIEETVLEVLSRVLVQGATAQ